MKTENVIKVLRRYSKSLGIMAQEAKKDGDTIAAEHYAFDKNAMDEAVRELEKRKE